MRQVALSSQTVVEVRMARAPGHTPTSRDHSRYRAHEQEREHEDHDGDRCGDGEPGPAEERRIHAWSLALRLLRGGLLEYIAYVLA